VQIHGQTLVGVNARQESIFGSTAPPHGFGRLGFEAILDGLVVVVIVLGRGRFQILVGGFLGRFEQVPGPRFVARSPGHGRNFIAFAYLEDVSICGSESSVYSRKWTVTLHPFWE